MNYLNQAQLTATLMRSQEIIGTKSASQMPEDKQVIANLLNPEGMSKKAQICQHIGTADLIERAEAAAAAEE